MSKRKKSTLFELLVQGATLSLLVGCGQPVATKTEAISPRPKLNLSTGGDGTSGANSKKPLPPSAAVQLNEGDGK